MPNPKTHVNDQKSYRSPVFLTGLFIMLLIFSVTIILTFWNGPLNPAGSIAFVVQSPSEYSFEFWLIFSIIIVCAAIITATVIILLPMRDEEYFPNIHRRDISDDIFSVFWFATWIFYGLPMAFRPERDAIRQDFEFYLYFSILSVAYIVLMKLNKIVRKIHTPDEKESIQLYDLGNGTQIFEVIIFGLAGFVVVIFYSLFIPVSPGIFTEDGQQHLLFNAFASVPAEEIVFRGLAIDIFVWISFEIYCDCKHIANKDRVLDKDHPEIVRIEAWCWVIAILCSAIAFAFYHVPRYGFDLWDLIYIFLLAIVAGILRYYFGLTAAYLTHFLNNFLADISAETIIPATLLPTDFQSAIYIILGLLFIDFLFFWRHKRKSKVP